VRRRHLAAAIMTVVGLGGAVMTMPLAARVVPRQITPLLIVDGYGLFYMALLITASMIVVIMAYGYLQGREGNLEEFYVLLLLATLGAVVLTLSNHGLFWRQPWLALVFTAALLSLTGIPLTAGFVGKFYVLVDGVESVLWPLILLLVFGSAVGATAEPLARKLYSRKVPRNAACAAK